MPKYNLYQVLLEWIVGKLVLDLPIDDREAIEKMIARNITIEDREAIEKMIARNITNGKLQEQRMMKNA